MHVRLCRFAWLIRERETFVNCIIDKKIARAQFEPRGLFHCEAVAFRYFTRRFPPSTWIDTQAFHIREHPLSSAVDRTYPPSPPIPSSLLLRWRPLSSQAAGRVADHKDAC